MLKITDLIAGIAYLLAGGFSLWAGRWTRRQVTKPKGRTASQSLWWAAGAVWLLLGVALLVSAFGVNAPFLAARPLGFILFGGQILLVAIFLAQAFIGNRREVDSKLVRLFPLHLGIATLLVLAAVARLAELLNS